MSYSEDKSKIGHALDKVMHPEKLDENTYGDWTAGTQYKRTKRYNSSSPRGYHFAVLRHKNGTVQDVSHTPHQDKNSAYDEARKKIKYWQETGGGKIGEETELDEARVKDLPVPVQHQIKIARKTLRMPDAMVGVMGGPSKEEARAILKKYGIKEEIELDEGTKVYQDGADFYKKGGGRIASYPHKVKDFDMKEAEKAREWFKSKYSHLNPVFEAKAICKTNYPSDATIIVDGDVTVCSMYPLKRKKKVRKESMSAWEPSKKEKEKMLHGSGGDMNKFDPSKKERKKYVHQSGGDMNKFDPSNKERKKRGLKGWKAKMRRQGFEEETEHLDEKHSKMQLKQARAYHDKEAGKHDASAEWPNTYDTPGTTRKGARHRQAVSAANRELNKWHKKNNPRHYRDSIGQDSGPFGVDKYRPLEKGSKKRGFKKNWPYKKYGGVEEETEHLDESRSLSQIAREIRSDWKKVNYAAKPYLDAMGQLDSIKDNYYQDSGKSVVAYFLGNARSWRGPKAKEIKAELNRMLKEETEHLDEGKPRYSRYNVETLPYSWEKGKIGNVSGPTTKHSNHRSLKAAANKLTSVIRNPKVKANKFYVRDKETGVIYSRNKARKVASESFEVKYARHGREFTKMFENENDFEAWYSRNKDRVTIKDSGEI